MKRLIENIHNQAAGMFRMYLKSQMDIKSPMCDLERANFKTG